VIVGFSWLFFFVPSTGFEWQGFGSGAAAGVASVRSCQKLPLCLTQPMRTGSKTYPTLAKAEPICDGGSASVLTYLRRKKQKKNHGQLQQVRGVTTCERNNSAVVGQLQGQ